MRKNRGLNLKKPVPVGQQTPRKTLYRSAGIPKNVTFLMKPLSRRVIWSPLKFALTIVDLNKFSLECVRTVCKKDSLSPPVSSLVLKFSSASWESLLIIRLSSAVRGERLTCTCAVIRLAKTELNWAPLITNNRDFSSAYRWRCLP